MINRICIISITDKLMSPVLSTAATSSCKLQFILITNTSIHFNNATVNAYIAQCACPQRIYLLLAEYIRKRIRYRFNSSDELIISVLVPKLHLQLYRITGISSLLRREEVPNLLHGQILLD